MPDNDPSADAALTRKNQVPPPVAEKPGDEMGTPEEHAYATGNGPAKYSGPIDAAPTTLTFNGVTELARFSVAHECAAILHGWHEHKHHADAPIQLRRKDYEAALKAAVEPWHAPSCPKRGHVLGDKDPTRHAEILSLHGSMIPHKAALSPHANAAHAEILKRAEFVLKPEAEKSK